MLLSTISLLLLVACIFGFKQSRELKRAKDLTNKQGLELTLIRSQYTHNITRLLKLEKDNEELSADISKLLKETQEKSQEIRYLLNSVETLKIDLDCSQDLQIDEDKFQEVIEAHVLNVLSHIDLAQAYEFACDNNNLEIDIEELVKS